MKTSFFVLFVFGLQAFASTMINGSIERVIDGDTVVFAPQGSLPNNQVDPMDGGKNPHVRMVGMDTPETHLQVEGGVYDQGPIAKAATRQLEKFLMTGVNKVTLEHMGYDKYKRTLGRIFKGGRDIHLEMIRSGYAVTYFLCIVSEGCNGNFFQENKAKEYIAACNEAKMEGRGIWDPADPLEEMPFEFRMRMQGRKPDRYVGDYVTKKLYQPSDYNKVSPCNRIFFYNKSDANQLGYK